MWQLYYEVPVLQVQPAGLFLFHWSCPFLCSPYLLSLLLFHTCLFFDVQVALLVVFGNSVVKHIENPSFPPEALLSHLSWLLSINHIQIAHVGHFFIVAEIDRFFLFKSVILVYQIEITQYE